MGKGADTTSQAPAMPTARACVAIIAVAVAGCSVMQPVPSHAPCWPDDANFSYEPMGVQGVVGYFEAPNNMVMVMESPGGGMMDLGWPLWTTETYGPGQQGHVSTRLNRVLAKTGDRVVLWGAFVSAARSVRVPASPGHDAFVVCELNGEDLTTLK